MSEDQTPGAGMIHGDKLAALLMISTERLRQLGKEGAIPRSVKGFYPFAPSVQGYIRFLKDQERRTTKVQADSRVRDARAAMIELQVAERRRALIPIEDATAALDTIVAKTRSEIVALPARLTRDMELRRTIEKEVDEALIRIAESLRKLGDTLSSGGELLDATEEDQS